MQDKIVELIPMVVTVSATGISGASCLLLLLFRRKKKFHGIYTMDLTSSGSTSGDEDAWFVPLITEQLRNGMLTVDEYIEKLVSCGKLTKFPVDTKMVIFVGDEILSIAASEKKLFDILRRTSLPLSVTFVSKKTGLEFTLKYR